MATSTKKALKSIKSRIEAKEHEAALYEASELLKRLDEKEPEAAQVLIFRGLALTHVEKKEEAEKCYLHAYRLQPSNPLASLGLRKLYEKDEQWEKLGSFLEVLVQAAYYEQDGEKCVGALQDLLELRSQHGPQEQLYRTLDLLLPSSPLLPLLQPLPPPADSYNPFPSPIYPPKSFAVVPTLPSPLPHALHLLSSLPLLLNLLIRSQVLVHQEVETRVKAGRTRLGAGPEKEVRKNVEAEVLGGEVGMKMVDLLREVEAHPGVDDAVRRDVEIQEFVYWRKLVGCLPSDDVAEPAAKVKTKSKVSSAQSEESKLPTPALFQASLLPKPNKLDALSRADGLARGFILLGIGSSGAEEGWSWVLEGKDEPTPFYDLDLLHRFAKTFPTSPLTDFIDDYCRWFKFPLPEPDEVAQTMEGPTEPNGEASKASKKARGYKRGKAGMNARERRKTRRLAGKEGVLAEDLDQEERDELVASMTRLLDKLPKFIFAHRVMARIAMQEEDWANAIAFAEKGRNLLKELEAERGLSLPNVHASLDTALGVALVPYFSPKHHPRATRLLNGVLEDQPTNTEARFARALIFQASGNWVEARKNFQILLDAGGDEKKMVTAKEEVGWCLVNEGKLEPGRDVLEKAVELRDARWEQEGKDDEAMPRARAWWRLGRTEWMIGDDESRQHAEEWFMASIRALPTFASAYSSLGICYSSASPPDEERALKCFQKAFELDATEADAARRLVIGYANDEEWASVRTTAMRVMEGEGGVDGVAGGEVMDALGRFAPKNGWAWKALGSTEMHYRNHAKAGQAYQVAVRADQNDVSTWVRLGESYIKCGRHIAGLKTLQHALELDPTNWMAMYDIGDIHTQLGSFNEAIDAYEQVARMTEDKETGVTAALAQAMLALGRQAAAGGFRARSRRAFHDSIELAGKVLQEGHKHRPWGWKLVADATFELSTQESSIAEAEASAQVLQPGLQLLVDNDTDRRSAVEGLGHAANLLQSPVNLDYTLETAVFAFAYRAHLLKNEPRVASSALYDLASALHAMAQRAANKSVKTSCMKGAISSIRLALERDAGDERLWNALAVICGDAGPEVAQHAFVVSLELYAKDPVVWTNLGYLYLRLDDAELANQCFLKTQIMDPDLAQAWLGQGFLAEQNGDTEHARALFAHSVTLSAGSLLEADLALAAATFERFLVPGTFMDNSVLLEPAFALKHYTQQRPRDAAAAHVYALICERLGGTDEAVASLERAAAILEEEFEATESTEIEKRYSMALCNLGRVRLATGGYQGSLEAFTNCWELDPPGASLRVQCKLGQGLAYFWLGQVDECFEAFLVSLDEAENSGEAGLKDEVVVLLSRTLWGLGSEDAKETAKTHLLESLSQERPPIKVVSTLGVIALVSSDEDLIDAALSELRSLPLERRALDDPSCRTDLVLYTNAIAQGDDQEALAILEAAVRIEPSSSSTRNKLANSLIATDKAEEAIGLLALQERGDDSTTVAETLRLRGIAEILGGDEEGVRRLQQAVRARPWEESGWQALTWGRTTVAEAKA